MNQIKSDDIQSTKKLFIIFSKIWSWVFLALIVIIFEIWARLTYDTTFIFNDFNLQSIGLATSQILLMSLGLTLVIISAGIDLSIGFISGLAAVTTAVAIRLFDPIFSPLVSLLLSVFVALIISLIPGIINGLLISRLKVPSFIGTLGMYGICRGAAFLIAGGATVSIQNPLAVYMGNENLLGIPIPIIITLILCAYLHYLLKHTKFGLHVYTMGGNENAAIRAGVNTNTLTVMLYSLSAFTAAISGLVYTSRFSAGAAQAGEPILLYAVAAVFIGGASLTGGYGTIMGTIIGSLIIAVIQFGLVFINVQPYWQFIAVGLVIIIAVLIDQSKDLLTNSGGS